MGKNTKVMPQYPAIYLFSWKGRESLHLKTLHKTKYRCAFCPAPSMQKIQIRTMRGRCTPKLPKNKYIFSANLHLSSNRRVRNLAFYFQFTTPARKLTHRMKFKHVWMQKDTNFGYTIILRHFRPEKCQKSDPERHEFGNAIILCYLGQRITKSNCKRHESHTELHSLTPTK